MLEATKEIRNQYLQKNCRSWNTFYIYKIFASTSEHRKHVCVCEQYSQLYKFAIT